MKGFFGFCCALLGVALAAYWLLFMSWSHSFGSPTFQRRETLVLWSAALAIAAGMVLMVAAWRQRRR